MNALFSRLGLLAVLLALFLPATASGQISEQRVREGAITPHSLSVYENPHPVYEMHVYTITDTILTTETMREKANIWDWILPRFELLPSPGLSLGIHFAPSPSAEDMPPTPKRRRST